MLDARPDIAILKDGFKKKRKHRQKSILVAETFGFRGDKSELSVVDMTPLLVLIYASTKYNQNLLNH